MNNKTDDKVLKLVQMALNNRHQKKDLIGNLSEYFVAKTLLKSFNRLYKGFDKSAKKAFKNYLKELKQATSSYIVNPTHLYEFIQLKTCRDYFFKEREMMKEVIREYTNYVFSEWHILDTLLFKDREDNNYLNFLRDKYTMKFEADNDE